MGGGGSSCCLEDVGLNSFLWTLNCLVPLGRLIGSLDMKSFVVDRVDISSLMDSSSRLVSS